MFAQGKRPGYSELKISKEHIKQTIFKHPEFTHFSKEMDELFTGWKTNTAAFLKKLTASSEDSFAVMAPKQTIHKISEDILQTYTGKALMDKYDVYQHVMNYWNETMQDDCYLIAVDGWKVVPYRIMVKNKAGKETDKGWDCDLVPKALLIDCLFEKEITLIRETQSLVENYITEKAQLEEEHGGEEGIFTNFEKLNKAAIQKRLKEIADDKTQASKENETLTLAAEPTAFYNKEKNEKEDEAVVLKDYLQLLESLANFTDALKRETAHLDKLAYERYKTLTEEEIKEMVVNNKWLWSIQLNVETEMDRINQRLTQRIKELAERYETPMPLQTAEVDALENNVNTHLQKMGFVWN